MSKKADPDARRILEFLRDESLTLRDVGQKLTVSPEAVDEARCLADEIDQAETDAILALPPILGRALLWAACAGDRHDVLREAALHGDKEVQREAKRIAHNLQRKGVALELPQKQAEMAARTEAGGQHEPPVFLSSLDSFGERAVFWTRSIPGRGIELAQLVVADDKGVIDLMVGEFSRKRFREMAEDLPRRGAVTIREVSRDDARVVLDRARVAAREGGQMPAHFPAWAAQVLGPTPPMAPSPLAPRGEGRPPEDATALGELVGDSVCLFREPEIQRWAPDEEAVRATARALDESPGHEGEVLLQSAEAFFDPARRASWAARLLDTALLFEETDRMHPARVAAATARLLAAGAPVVHIPFCGEFFGRLFSRADQETAPKADAE